MQKTLSNQILIYVILFIKIFNNMALFDEFYLIKFTQFLLHVEDFIAIYLVFINDLLYYLVFINDLLYYLLYYLIIY